LTRVVRLVAALACVAFLVAGVAHAGHVHTKKATNGKHTELACQLCLQFDRTASTPPPVVLAAPSTMIWRMAAAIAPLVRVTLSLARYEARGPPHV
jgi:hypothetical protein